MSSGDFFRRYIMQTCNKCKNDKSDDCFAKDASKKNGLRLTCKECSNVAAKEWRSKNKLRATITRLYWRKSNYDRYSYMRAKYRANRLNAQPKCLPESDISRMKEVYGLAAYLTHTTGVQHQVDHIHPLNGDGFCGLHVPWNLQVLTYEENALKSNRFPKDEEHMLWTTESKKRTTDLKSQTGSSSMSKPPGWTGGQIKYVGTSSRSDLWRKIRFIFRCDTAADLIYQKIRFGKC